MRILGIDFGERRIGLAMSDPAGRLALPLETVVRGADDAHLTYIRELCEEHGVGEVVIGLPLSLRGEVGPQAEATLLFAEKLKESLRVPVRTWDERLTTLSASRALAEANVSRKKRKEVVDKVAATLILQAYLDSKETGAQRNWEQENTQQEQE
ncbi:MAG: Holliday junction DNA helicase RuvA [Candidatus Aquicultor primus]|uniref:Putative pre-16S rRNA nuclease n=1 Tax=Candidatus Aquicultor primus TaxID=1797195 RepID=A0A1F2UPB5_9ACTN|nr:MAG: Holliday junction DNA helicase RuvA [Candidatus Aquicultor primus]HCG99293.1 Holliday junction resolvase RuvX [Actinomycetota bacterium]